MKSVKKISARLQKKLAGKTEIAVQPAQPEKPIQPVVTNNAKPLDNIKLFLADIIGAAKQNDPKVFENTETKQVVAIARSILEELNNQIHNTEEGIIIVPTIGRFVIRQRIVQKDNEPQTIRNIQFLPAPKKTDAAV